MKWIKRLLRAFERLMVLITALVVITICLVLYIFGRPGPDYVKRYDQPLSYQQASRMQEIHFPLPPSSSEIYFGEYADWQVFTRLVRFKAPAEDCVKHVDAVIAWLRAKDSMVSFPPPAEVTEVDTPGAALLQPAPWFDPQTITHGLHTMDGPGRDTQIWINLDKGIFYYKETQ